MARAFTLLPAPAVVAGIELDEIGQLVLGEFGRGRTRVVVPIPAGSTVEPGRDGYPARLTEIPVREGPGAVVVRIPDMSGYRGGWYLRAARSPEQWSSFVALAEEHDADRTGIAYGDLGPQGHGHYDRCEACAAVPDERIGRGTWLRRQPIPGRVIARGVCAQGDAGRMGGGEDLLLVLHPGEAVEVIRQGRLYGRPEVIRLANVAVEAGEAVATDPAAEAQAALAGAAW